MAVLITGGTGYIGSHTVVEMLNNDYEVIIVDNLSNSKIDVLDKIYKITGKKVKFYQYDLCDETLVDKLFNENKIDAVIHFAGLKAVGESTMKPIEYYYNNILSTLNLIKVMKKNDVKKIIFSSSATVYGKQDKFPIEEGFKLNEPTNPYGKTKLYIENILKDLYKSDSSWDITLLRYFNPIGAHESGLIGEVPNGIPNNLMPYINQVATGKREKLFVFGNDYDTVDGTGVRDYIHVCDLAYGHLCALKHLKGLNIYNLGTGNGYSVLEIVKAYERVNNVKIKYEIAPRREGDIDTCYASPKKAEDEIGFKCTRDLDEMCRSSYNFEKKNNKL
ncbi:MAG: UDP-glucose 4-epimerase GalE [Bacilli bacterium]|nr:UDP-glucose 4-epimerase GalE [Bacilli bacterium]